MAKRKTKKATNAVPDLKEWYYVGPPYPRVKIEGIPIIDPQTITQARLGALMKRFPEKLGPYFTRAERVKPGIETAADEQQETEESEQSTSDD